MVHHDQRSARPQDAPCFVERAFRIGNDADHIGRERDVEPGVGKLQRARVHHVQALHLGEPLRATRARAARNIGAQMSMPVTSTCRAEAAVRARRRRPTTRIRRQDRPPRPRPALPPPAQMERQIEDEVINRRPAAIGRFRRLSRMSVRRVDRIYPRLSCKLDSPVLRLEYVGNDSKESSRRDRASTRPRGLGGHSSRFSLMLSGAPGSAPRARRQIGEL